MRTKARAWIENGVIRCMSQMCEAGGMRCPRFEKCEAVVVTILEVTNYATQEEKRQT